MKSSIIEYYSSEKNRTGGNLGGVRAMIMRPDSGIMRIQMEFAIFMKDLKKRYSQMTRSASGHRWIGRTNFCDVGF